MTVKERILQIAEYKGIAKTLFCEKIGSTYGNFTGTNKNRPINSDSLANILVICPEISIDWLLTGEGNMLKEEAKEATSEICQSCANKERKIKELEKTIAEKERTIAAMEFAIKAQETTIATLQNKAF